ncbi:antibiotic biosynthesis monooxygenase family protein [Streptomyces sp. NPDC056987]|uniref:antibiotic biosynthesis monooxygenase family protein n=1 Tax=Streptomyces sp. NPDC056987 TaxID=3345988 RepID=UPI00362DD350
MSPGLRVLLEIRIAPGHEAEFEELWRGHADLVRRLPDNHGQQLYRLAGSDGCYTVLTDWTDEPSFRAFERSEAQQAYLGRLWPMREGGGMSLLEPLHKLSGHALSGHELPGHETPTAEVSGRNETGGNA